MVVPCHLVDRARNAAIPSQRPYSDCAGPPRSLLFTPGPRANSLCSPSNEWNASMTKASTCMQCIQAKRLDLLGAFMLERRQIETELPDPLGRLHAVPGSGQCETQGLTFAAVQLT